METSRPKNLRKTCEGDFKRMELTWGMADREAKERFSGIEANKECLNLPGCYYHNLLYRPSQLNQV